MPETIRAIRVVQGVSRGDGVPTGWTEVRLRIDGRRVRLRATADEARAVRDILQSRQRLTESLCAHRQCRGTQRGRPAIYDHGFLLAIGYRRQRGQWARASHGYTPVEQLAMRYALLDAGYRRAWSFDGYVAVTRDIEKARFRARLQGRRVSESAMWAEAIAARAGEQHVR